MTYHLRVPTDGAGLLATRISEAFLLGEKLNNRNPKRSIEFQIDESYGVLEPDSQVEIIVSEMREIERDDCSKLTIKIFICFSVDVCYLTLPCVDHFLY